MARLRNALYLGLDAFSVSAATVARGLGGARLVAFRRVPLSPGALAVSASSRNVTRPDEASAAVGRALAGVGAPSGPAVVVIPDGVARLALLPRLSDADPRDLVRFRLGTSLPWEAAETVVDALPAGRGYLVGAALRRATVLEHEQAAAAAGLARDRVHLAPLLALAPLLRPSTPDGVHILLGDAAVTFAAVRGGALVALRSRRRDPSAGEAGRLVAEAARISERLDPPARLAVAFVGTDAADIRRDVVAAGVVRVLPGRADGDAGEPAWLEGVLA